MQEAGKGGRHVLPHLFLLMWFEEQVFSYVQQVTNGSVKYSSGILRGWYQIPLFQGGKYYHWSLIKDISTGSTVAEAPSFLFQDDHTGILRHASAWYVPRGDHKSCRSWERISFYHECWAGSEGKHFKNFIQRAIASRQYNGPSHFSYRAAFLRMVSTTSNSVKTIVLAFPFSEQFRNDTDHLALFLQNSISNNRHQPFITTAVNECDVVSASKCPSSLYAKWTKDCCRYCFRRKPQWNVSPWFMIIYRKRHKVFLFSILILRDADFINRLQLFWIAYKPFLCRHSPLLGFVLGYFICCSP